MVVGSEMQRSSFSTSPVSQTLGSSPLFHQLVQRDFSATLCHFHHNPRSEALVSPPARFQRWPNFEENVQSKNWIKEDFTGYRWERTHARSASAQSCSIRRLVLQNLSISCLVRENVLSSPPRLEDSPGEFQPAMREPISVSVLLGEKN
eukprot:TRINITY_DN5722_c0_g1_i3.p1 TRINITY_DN5722_c0_g1~~TRINITY_DN5722_c0_g1_i3.p1  ORF type:complete len:149 (-),score=24.36 TRINITY_DN5722_c0_g1_i3:234-680(-)